jgi:hypothetical protein
VSAATSPPPATTGSQGTAPAPGGAAPGPAGGPDPGAPALEACPLCGAPLRPDQEWCLHCGAAARTRLATSSNWKAPIIAVAVIVTLSLGVLAASLVSLNSDKTTTVIRTVTTSQAVITPTATTLAPTTSTPTTITPPSTPGAATKTPGIASPALTKRITELEARQKSAKSAAEKARLHEEVLRLKAAK